MITSNSTIANAAKRKRVDRVMHQNVIDYYATAVCLFHKLFGFCLVPSEQICGKRPFAFLDKVDGLIERRKWNYWKNRTKNLKLYNDFVVVIVEFSTSSCITKSSASLSMIIGGMNKSSRSNSPKIIVFFFWLFSKIVTRRLNIKKIILNYCKNSKIYS